MAKKLDVDIDPGKFLDSFRPEMPASAPEVEDKAEGNAGGKPAAERTKAPQKTPRTGKGKEEEYLERFLNPRKSRYAPARQPIYARATTSGYSASCRSSARTGLPCRSMWTAYWKNTSASMRK